MDGLKIARQRIADEAERPTGILDLGRLGLSHLPEEVFELSGLRTLNLGSRFNFEGDDYIEAASDIAPNAIGEELDRLAELPVLTALSLRGMSIADLSPLRSIGQLDTLDCSETSVSDLTPLGELTALQTLHCWNTSVCDLTPLAALTVLQHLDCRLTSVSDLSPLAALTALQTLRCAYTSVSDLSPLEALTTLQHLECSNTSVCDLAPLGRLTLLEKLGIRGNHIEYVEPMFWSNTSLTEVVAYGTELQGFPQEALSQNSNENCLPAVRAHVNDLGNDPVPLDQVKLMILGNGRIGKTQICNRLRDLPYDDDADSTHGVTVSGAPIPGGDGTFAIWDFGGQDIYHGTHALFLKSRAVFVLVWTPETDDVTEHEHRGMRFRNQPLSWWLDYVRRFGSEQSPLVVVQNRLDTNRDRGDHPAVAPLREFLAFCRSVAYSAATNEGRGALDDYLERAARRFNPPLIGAARKCVMDRLVAMREADAALPPDERRHRTLTLFEFALICEAAGGVSDTTQLLRFLHNAGVVFWQEGLFEDRIVLDQAWVLDAIYTVFDRENTLQRLRARAGRFTRFELGWMVWNERYSPAEQELFVSFMRSCGICFAIARETPNTEPIYVAPDLLPENWSPVERTERWGEAPPEHERRLGYEMLPPALLRNLICRIGERAGIRCDYWRNGLYGFEAETGSRVLLEQEIGDDWRGKIAIRTRGGRSRELLDRMVKTLAEEEERLGLSGIELSETRAEISPNAPTMVFVDAPDKERTFYVSYAWAERTDTEEHSREAIVDGFCEAAARRGIRIRRDREDMSIGERISAFMSRLARADRVIVVLSDKYLRSPFCMQELHGIWVHSRSEGERFLKRVRVYTEEDARVWTVAGRAEYAVYWKEEHSKIESMVKRHGINVLGEQDTLLFRQMERFSIEIGNVLGALTDVLQPRSLDELVDYSFEDEDFDD